MRALHLSLLAALGVGAAASSSVACGSSDSETPTSASTSASVGGSSSGGSGGGGGLAVGGAGGSSGGAGGGGAGGMAGISTCGIGMWPGGGAGGVGGGAAGQGRVRVVAANLSSGNGQSYDGDHGVRILQGLDADIVLLQEMNFGNQSESAINTLVDDICFGKCNYIRGPQAQIPNGVLSRYPIDECGSWVDPEVNNRNFVWARIDVPGDVDLWAISVHLLGSNATKRALEASALLDEIAAGIPTGDMIVLGGDLNTNSRGESAVMLLSSVFNTASPYPVDQNGNGMTNQPRSKPYDWVLADSQLSPLEIPVAIGNSTFPSGAVIDTRDYVPLADIAPALFGDSDAPSMQHMAVIKDFQIDPEPDI